MATAHTLLKTHPALGLLVARAAIDPDRELDSEMLLEAIDEIRDRLLLDPDEPWREFYALLIESRHESAAHALAWEANDQEREALSEEVRELRGELRQASEQAQRLTAELRARRDELESLAREREELSTIITTSLGGDRVARMSDLEAERFRLRERINALEKQISAGNEQRADMRRQLNRLAVEQPARPLAAPDAVVADEADHEAGPAPPRFVLVPSYLAAATKRLASLPRHIAAQALRCTAALAAGDDHAWKGVKRMRATENVHSARVGHSHRLLFRFGDGKIEILDVVDRKDLDTAVARHA
jgi:Tfp pilus assembly protein PilO